MRDLRILAITADDPETLVDVNLIADPSVTDADWNERFGRRIHLDALVVDPLGQDGGVARPVHFRMVACGNDPGSSERGRTRGPGSVRDTVSRGACPSGTPAFAEGDSVAAPGDPVVRGIFVATREFLLAAAKADPLGVRLGLPITIELTVTAGAETAVAIKRVIFTPLVEGGLQSVNDNPSEPELAWRLTSSAPLTFFGTMNPSVVPLGGKLIISPAAATPEVYAALVLDRTTGRVMLQPGFHETIRFAFYASVGKFSPGKVSTQRQVLRGPRESVNLDTKYEAPAALQPGQDPVVTIWVVARDERGGASYTGVHLMLR